MKRYVWMLISAAALFMIPMAAHAGEEHHPSARNPLGLSHELAKLIGQEMIAIEQGMKNLISAIASGKWEEVAKIGEKIKESYIMKQKLTQEQMEELHHSLPAPFIEMDHAFHERAGLLAHAARQKNGDVVNFYFYKLNESCVECHTKYGTRRFPGFSSKVDHEEHKH